jgi:hypothetical protein
VKVPTPNVQLLADSRFAHPSPLGGAKFGIFREIYFLYNGYTQMAYRRNYRRSYRPRYRPSYRKRYYPRRVAKSPPKDDVWAVAKGAWNIGKRIARLVNVEKKIHEVTLSSVAISSSGTRYSLWGSEGTVMTASSSATGYLAQGDTHAQRDGASIKPLSLRLKGRFHINGSAATTTVRVIIFQKPQTNATAPSPTDYLNTASPLSLKNWSERFRFRTLWDKIYTLEINTDKQRALFDKTIKLNGHVTFTHGATTVETGGLYVLFIADEPTNTPTVDLHARLIFVDN